MQTGQTDILLVEDNPFEAKLAIRALSQHHLADHLHHVIDGAEALDFIYAREEYEHRSGEKYPKIILLDLKLPKVNGLEVVEALKSDPLTRAIPIVILTASDQEKDIRAGYELGVNSFIVKPIDFTSFSRVVTELGLYWTFLNQTPESIR